MNWFSMMKPCQSKINQSTQKRVNTRNKMEGPTSKKTKEPPKRANHKGNIKFLNRVQRWHQMASPKAEKGCVRRIDGLW
jgi:hypothetical protein